MCKWAIPNAIICICLALNFLRHRGEFLPSAVLLFLSLLATLGAGSTTSIQPTEIPLEFVPIEVMLGANWISETTLAIPSLYVSLVMPVARRFVNQICKSFLCVYVTSNYASNNIILGGVRSHQRSFPHPVVDGR